ncbi:hypothetical protein GCM10027447_03990 [Glycomyces halotolerans]
MGKGSERKYRVVPVDEEPDFGDPPRHWGRVASMAGLWAVVLFGGAWMAPGFASGGASDETDARDQAPITPRQAAARYLEAGLNGESDRAGAVLCDDAAPQMLQSDLVALRDEYDEALGAYPEIEVSTTEPVGSASGMVVDSTVSFIGDSIFREQFTVTVLATGSRYCVSEVVRVRSDDEDAADRVDPQDQAAKFLSAVFVVRDPNLASSHLCVGYDGPQPEELENALREWEGVFGDATPVQSFEGEPTESDSGTVVPMSVELSSLRATESFAFEVTIVNNCITKVSGDEALLHPSDD